MVSPVITGYYRYTDIWFEWHQALPDPDDRPPLKAILAHDALAHPDHPLRKQGIDGAELYMGTLQNYETRLLFSSAQVEYLRYWLHAMQLTKSLIPLPYSDCLLTESDLRNVSPVVYKTGGDIRGAIKKIDKNNKRLKGANPMLTSRRDIFERVRTCWAEKKGIWCAVDFEAWDRDHTVLTEFGWRIWRWGEGGDGKEGWGDGREEMGHLIVDEHRHYSNTYVPNHRDHYQFGKSEIVKRAVFQLRIQSLLDELIADSPLFLVFHDNSQDIKYLSTVHPTLPHLEHVLPDHMPDTGTFVVDTADLFAALEGEGGGNKRALERVCRHLQIRTGLMHNAGNDAYYTLEAAQSMASGDPVDIQREKRWPNRITPLAPGLTPSFPTPPKSNMQVQFHPWEEFDEDDEDGDLFPMVPGSGRAGV